MIQCNRLKSQTKSEKVKEEIEESVIKVLEGNVNLDNIVDSVGEMVNNIEISTLLAIISELNGII